MSDHEAKQAAYVARRAKAAGTDDGTDRLTAKVIAELHARAAMGRRKYGVSLADAGLSRRQLLQHAKEEALDQAIYLQALIELEDETAGRFF